MKQYKINEVLKMVQEQLKELIEQASLELMCAESYFNNCDAEHFDDALVNLNSKREKLSSLYRIAKFGEWDSLSSYE